ncbi:hypothetical protein IVA95_24925 [Bradyrhizobium sp. 157]|jgi:hypothetical protein|uniref:hypothetical protein n=1 Tax=Bradyrhizobium sp. 157 TaxID=2782631 RepID=UPI001FF7339B|nr:hypothetical protein [Bradyrhizobium sp. 157]MCK1640740.1 hypothetical protein [Bradyrhizobium sp. 157]
MILMFASGAAKLIMRGLDPRIHLLRKKCFFRRWIAGSSPAMTACASGNFA